MTTKHYHFSGEMYPEQVNDLLSKMEHFVDTYDKVFLYFKSTGGTSSCLYILMDFFRQPEVTAKVVLYATATIQSAAFTFFMTYEGERRVLDDCVGMVHSWVEDGRVRMADQLCLTAMNKAHLSWLSVFLTSAEMKTVREGNDVFTDPQRLKKIDEQLKLMQHETN